MKNKLALYLLTSSLILCSCVFNSKQEKEKEKQDIPTIIEGNYLLKDNTSNYCVVIPENSNSYEILAANEFVGKIKESSGINFDIRKDKDISYNSESRIISLGFTSIAENFKLKNTASTVKSSGYYLVTKDNSIFVYGSTPIGTLYGTYDLLHDLINYEAYSYDTICFDKDIKEIPLKKYNILKNPTIESTQCYEYEIIHDTDYAHVMKNLTGDESWVKVNGKFCHTATELVPNSLREEHPTWFSSDGNQLCYSEGLVNEEMQDYLYRNLKNAIDTYPNAKYVSVSQADVNTWCTCDRCKESKARYGSNLAVIVKFVNLIADKVKRDYPNRNLFVHTFSYHQTTDAIINHFDEVKCRDNVTVMFAPIRGNFTKEFDDPTNANLKASLESIAKICNHVTLWTYNAYMHYYFLPFNPYTGLKNRISIYEKNNVKFLFDQGEFDSNNPCFRRLRTYLTSKLCYDNSLDQNELIDNFFINYYGDGYKNIRKYFDEMRLWSIHAVNDLKMSYDINGTGMFDSKFWPYNTLKSWEQYFKEALNDIEYLKYFDNDLYQLYYDHINLESLSIRYMLIVLYGSTYYQPSELYQMMIDFRNDCYKYNIVMRGENSNIEVLYSEWGI